MIPVSTFAGASVAVFGLGSSGIASARALIAGGADVAAWDDGEAGRAAAQSAGLPLRDLTTADWSRFQALVLAPGVPLTHPKPHWTVTRAQAAGIEIIGDIELFCRERAAVCPDAPFIAVTGTNGKSTTTALIAHILKTAGKDVQMGGNIGVPILDLEPPAMERVHVIECSSFQIDLAPSLAPTVGVLLNITPDHLDRHGTMAVYAGLKERVVANAARRIVGADDDLCRDIGERLRMSERGWVDVVSAHERVPHGWYCEGTALVCRAPWLSVPRPFVNLDSATALRGAHNVQNALAASAAAFILGLDVETVARGLTTFPGLPHRMEEIGRIGPVLVINDSKATNADSAEKALSAFDRDIFWIAGGKPKEGGIEPLRPLFGRIAKAYLIGQAAHAFAATLDGSVQCEVSGALDAALTAAARDAALSSGPEPVILLSPACASYDQFRSFEHRGDIFRQLAATLPGFVARERP